MLLKTIAKIFSSFLSLLDTPGSYSGQGGRYLKCNSGETGLVFDDDFFSKVTTVDNKLYGVQTLTAVVAQSTPDMTVKVDSGVIVLPDGSIVTHNGTASIAVTTADATSPRRDIVYITSVGNFGYAAGTPSMSPAVPYKPDDAILLAEIYVKALATSIRNNDIKDRREWKTLPEENSIVYVSDFRVDTPWTATQGIATDGAYLYATTDRNPSFTLQNFITKFDFAGNVILTKTNSYTNTDPYGNFMSQFSALCHGGILYVVVSNWNSRGTDPEFNRVVTFNTTDLSVIAEYDIGAGGAEGLDYKDGFFYICYHDKTEVKKFNTSFVLQDTLNLDCGPLTFVDGMYQGIIFYGNKAVLTTHGPNTRNNAIPDYGGTSGAWDSFLDVYDFDGEVFTFSNRLNAPTFGAGQGIARLDPYIYWIDRVDNRVVKSYSPIHIESRSALTLKRESGDFNVFSEKTVVAGNDIVLIEDSANSFKKKKAKLSNLTSTPLTVKEIDGSPSYANISTLQVPNGSLTLMSAGVARLNLNSVDAFDGGAFTDTYVATVNFDGGAF